MKHQRPKSFIAPTVLLLVSSLLISSCESSRVGPELPQPNPPAPAAQPLILTGFVKDLASQSAISGATVKIANAAQTVLTTILTDNNGKYAYDASNVPDNSLAVSASKDGYAFKTETATLLKTSNSASVEDILLAKLSVASTSVSVNSGGTVSAPSTQSAASQPLTVTVPANAVAQQITLTAAAIPAGQIPQPTNQSVVSAGQFGPSGTTFLQPVNISFPLPSAKTPGSTFQLMQLNEQTGTYTNSGFIATVDASGTKATAPVTHFTIYSLADNKVIADLTNGATTFGSSSYYSLSSGSGTTSFSATNTFSSSGGSGTVSDTYLKDLASEALNIDFATKSLLVGGNFPQLGADKLENNVQKAPAGAPASGNWEYRWYVLLRTIPVTGTISQGTEWSRNVTISRQRWYNDNDPGITLPASYGPVKTGWYWVSHDQGGFVGGPY